MDYPNPITAQLHQQIFGRKLEIRCRTAIQRLVRNWLVIIKNKINSQILDKLQSNPSHHLGASLWMKSHE